MFYLQSVRTYKYYSHYEKAATFQVPRRLQKVSMIIFVEGRVLPHIIYKLIRNSLKQNKHFFVRWFDLIHSVNDKIYADFF